MHTAIIVKWERQRWRSNTAFQNIAWTLTSWLIRAASVKLPELKRCFQKQLLAVWRKWNSSFNRLGLQQLIAKSSCGLTGNVEPEFSKTDFTSEQLLSFGFMNEAALIKRNLRISHRNWSTEGLLVCTYALLGAYRLLQLCIFSISS